jgi:hypothetical protein
MKESFALACAMFDADPSLGGGIVATRFQLLQKFLGELRSTK